MPRFDAYTATTRAATVPALVDLLVTEDSDRVTEGRGFHTFGHRVAVRDHAGDEVGSVQFGGRQGDRIMVEVKGVRTPQVVEGLRRMAEHRCTRVDSCEDFERPGIFDELLASVLEVKQEFGLYGEKRGDWSFPELGRTQMLGKPGCVNMVRLYEKGKQPEYVHLQRPDLVRLELQTRPQKAARDVYASLDASQVWGASKFTRALAARILERKLDAFPAGTVRKDAKREQAVRWMAKQYGAHLVSLAEDLGGWECLGLTLREMIEEERKRGDV
jgi:DNA relaxase NicK